MPKTPRIRLNITTLSKAAALLLVSTTANAAALTWDTASGDGATITDGGGTWINGGGNWNNAGTDATWNSGTPDSAIFNGALGGAINVDAGGVTTSGISIGGAQNYTFSGGAIGGTGGLTKNGTGTLTLSGQNTYTGLTSVGAGTLVVTIPAGNDSNSLYTGGFSVASGAALTLGLSNVGFASGLQLGTVALRGGTLNLDTTNGGSLFRGTTFTGNGTINKTGAGEAVLNWNGTPLNNFASLSGTFNINAGSVQFNNNASSFGTGLTDMSLVDFNLNTSGARLNLVRGALKIGALNGVIGSTVDNTVGGGAQTLSVGNNNRSGTFDGVIAGGATIGLTKVGSGTQTLSGANTYTGATTVNGGVLNLTGSLTSAVTVNEGGALSGTGSTTGNITFNNGSAIVLNASGAVQGNNVTFAATTNVFVADAPTGSVVTRDVIRYTGASSPGVANLSAATNYRNGAYTDDTGNKKITLAYQTEAKTWSSTSGGTWDTGATSTWSGGSDNKFFWGDSVAFGNTSSDQTVTLTGNLAPSSITVSNSANTYTFSGTGSIVGTSGITKSGDGTLVIANTGTNTYTGLTTVSDGTLNVVLPGGTVNGSSVYTGGFNVAAGKNLGLDLSSVGNVYNIQLGAIALNSGSTLTLTNTNAANDGFLFKRTTFTGSGGIINKQGAGYICLNWDGGFSDWSGFSGTLNINEGIIGSNVTSGGTNNMSKVAVNISSGATLDVRTGTLMIDSLNGVANSLVSGSHNGGNTLSVGNNNGSGTFAGIIQNGASSGLAFTKNGTGTQTLTGVNTYTGATLANAGTLLVNGSTHANSAVTVASGARLGGTGTVGGATTVNGVIRGGDGSGATGTLTVGNVTLASGSIVELALGAGGAHSTLAFNGTESFQSNQIFSFLDFGATTGTYAGLISGVTLDPTNTTGWTISNSGWLGNFTWNSGTNAIDLTLTAVPEPSTYGLLGAGALAGVALVRRRRKTVA